MLEAKNLRHFNTYTYTPLIFYFPLDCLNDSQHPYLQADIRSGLGCHVTVE